MIKDQIVFSLEILPMKKMKTREIKSFVLNYKAIYLMAQIGKEYHFL